jgi:hypothetical protein
MLGLLICYVLSGVSMVYIRYSVKVCCFDGVEVVVLLSLVGL